MANVDVTRIASNIGALNSLWALQTVNKQLGIAQTRLSTGKRINSASDDPAGLTIATKLLSRSEGLKVALGNIGDSKNLLAVAEAGVGRITDILIQMKNKASQGASDTMGSNERKAIQAQLDAYAQQIDDIVKQTNWNGNKLIDGSKNGDALSFQTGADSSDVTDVSGLINLSATADNSTNGASLSLAEQAVAAASARLVTTAALTDTIGAAGADEVTTNDTLATGTYTIQLSNINGPATWDATLATGAPAFMTAATSAVTTGTEFANGTYTIETAVEGAGTTADPFTYAFRVLDSTGAVIDDVTDATPTTGWVAVAAAGDFDTGMGFTLTFTDPDAEGADFAASTTIDYTRYNEFTTGTVSLLDEAGAALATPVTANNVDLSEAQTYDFGNGLTVDLRALAAPTSTANISALVDYTAITEAADGYRVKSGGATGFALDDVYDGRTAAGNYRALMGYLEGKLDTVNSMMSKIGAFTGRLEFKEDQVMAAQINVEASYNRIMNANMAEEQVNSSKFQILQQTAIAMLAQANQATASLLSLFR
jgi:flagellin